VLLLGSKYVTNYLQFFKKDEVKSHTFVWDKKRLYFGCFFKILIDVDRVLHGANENTSDLVSALYRSRIVLNNY
jgi:hypothetical protein